MVGVRLDGMDVRDLDNSQESHQDEADDRRRHEHAWPGEEGLVPSWLGSTQGCAPFLKNTVNLMQDEVWGLRECRHGRDLSDAGHPPVGHSLV